MRTKEQWFWQALSDATSARSMGALSHYYSELEMITKNSPYTGYFLVSLHKQGRRQELQAIFDKYCKD